MTLGWIWAFPSLSGWSSPIPFDFSRLLACSVLNVLLPTAFDTAETKNANSLLKSSSFPWSDLGSPLKSRLLCQTACLISPLDLCSKPLQCRLVWNSLIFSPPLTLSCPLSQLKWEKLWWFQPRAAVSSFVSVSLWLSHPIHQLRLRLPPKYTGSQNN